MEHLLFRVILTNQKDLASRNIVLCQPSYIVEPKSLYTPSDLFTYKMKKKKSFYQLEIQADSEMFALCYHEISLLS